MNANIEIEDDFSIFDQMEHEKFVSMVTGAAFTHAYTSKHDFDDALTEFCLVLSKRQQRFAAFFVPDAMRMFLGSAFRQAVTTELIHKSALDYFDKLHKFSIAMLIYHDLIDGIVHNLAASMSFITKQVVADELRFKPEVVQLDYDRIFPNLRIARNAIAHEDERILPSKSEDVEQQILSVQHRRHFASSISGLRQNNRREFSFDFSSQKIHSLVVSLSKTLTPSTQPLVSSEDLLTDHAKKPEGLST